MEEAVQAALTAAQPGDILLFSPGFTSFGLFKNEYERNDAFLAALSASAGSTSDTPETDESSTFVG